MRTFCFMTINYTQFCFCYTKKTEEDLTQLPKLPHPFLFLLAKNLPKICQMCNFQCKNLLQVHCFIPCLHFIRISTVFREFGTQLTCLDSLEPFLRRRDHVLKNRSCGSARSGSAVYPTDGCEVVYFLMRGPSLR